MASPTETAATVVFVVHFWREWTGTESRWRGRVEHVQSGQRQDFLEINGLLSFLSHFGIGPAAPVAARADDTVSLAREGDSISGPRIETRSADQQGI